MTRVLTLLLLAVAVALPGVASAQAYKEAYNAANEAASAKDYMAAYEQYQVALEGAVEAEDEEVEARSRYVLAQLDYALSVRKLKADENEEALAGFETGISHDPSFAMNYVGKAEALKAMNRDEDAIGAYGMAIEVAEAGDKARGTAVKNMLALIGSTGDLLGGANPSRTKASAALEQLVALDSTLSSEPEYHLYVARAHNVLGDYSAARTAASAGLALDPNDRNDAAALHFVTGDSYRLQSNYDAARTAYGSAAYGNYRDQANYYIETMGKEQ